MRSHSLHSPLHPLRSRKQGPYLFFLPPMKPAMLLLLQLLLLCSLLRLAITTADTNGAIGSCAPTTCGNLSITYPFSLGGKQLLYCGFPSFVLMCDDRGHAYLNRTFRENLYRVDNISYGDHSLVLAVETTFAGDETCPVPDFNVSAGLSLFALKMSDANRNLVFAYNCEVPSSARLQRGCANHTMGAYIAGSETWAVPKNCSTVSVPVRGLEREMEPPPEHYKELIDEGFLVEWRAIGDCDACTGRGGECRFVEFAFQCFCPDGDGRPGRNSRDQRDKSILRVALSVPAASLILTCLVWIMYRRKQKHTPFNQKYIGNGSNIEEMLKGYDSLIPKRYKYSELKKITGCFKDKLGEGGYGTVFRGNLQDGRKVAVKLLNQSKGNGDEFVNEVVSIRRTSHVNIVNLLGFCLHGTKRALIYEYMANGSLEKYIYSEETKRAIGWVKLREIAIGIARGLEYLHRGCNTRIIHFDIKPHNILLDEDFCPKIADFGLAKLCHLKDSALSMAEARGTIGFIAPEVFSRGFGVVSTKSDVYSYGMMLLEMVGGRKNVKDSSHAYFPNWIYDRLVKDLQNHEVTCETEEAARQMTLVGLWCIQTAPGNRPSMTRVIEMLEKNVNELEIPPKPFLSCPSEPSCFSS